MAEFPRILTSAERRALLDLLERSPVPQREVLLRQIDHATVVGGCDCPCPTISLAVDASSARPATYTAKPVATADYDGGSVMAWVEDGWLSHLELYWWTDGPPPSEFPQPEEMSGHRFR